MFGEHPMSEVVSSLHLATPPVLLWPLCLPASVQFVFETTQDSEMCSNSWREMLIYCERMEHILQTDSKCTRKEQKSNRVSVVSGARRVPVVL